MTAFQTNANITKSCGNLTGASGKVCSFVGKLQVKPWGGAVWTARHGGDIFVLKEMLKSTFNEYNGFLKPRLPESPNVKLPVDTIPGESIFVYRYMTEDFFQLLKKNVSVSNRKAVLKADLQGLADLHDKEIAHLDVKPHNIMVDYEHKDEDTIVRSVQLIDLEEAGYVPLIRKGGVLRGNENWRSPEALLTGRLTQASDISSFGIVCIYAMINMLILENDNTMKLQVDIGKWRPETVRVHRLVSIFGLEEDLLGLSEYSRSPDTTMGLLRGLWDTRDTYFPFDEWPVDDEDFKDLISKMMRLDPRKRISAREALEHPRFKGQRVGN